MLLAFIKIVYTLKVNKLEGIWSFLPCSTPPAAHLYIGNLYASWLVYQISARCELELLSYECLRNRVHSGNDSSSTGMPGAAVIT